jgi:hypothetical protein
MAPKKKEEVKEKPILGRFKSNLKVMRSAGVQHRVSALTLPCTTAL